MNNPGTLIRNPFWRLSRRLARPKEEWFDVFDERGILIASAPRSFCHSGTFLLHKVGHLVVVNRAGEILLQKRNDDKDVQPGKWDTSVGGHLHHRESPEAGVLRETREELGLDLGGSDIRFLYEYRMRSEIELEWVHTFLHVTSSENFKFDPAEISEVRFWSPGEIRGVLSAGFFTPNFEDEFRRYSEWMDHDRR